MPIVLATALSWLGLYLHNVNDLPHQTPQSPESALPGALLLMLLAAWAVRPLRRACTIALLGWGWLNLVGGALSVLPLPIWPFYPEQTLHHYAWHAMYAVLQIPLLVVATRYLRDRRPSSRSN
ncbi:hypothetical protein JMUB6875_29350 [Nocardia sp. JMUB6875]